jgi:hypothetical protein
LLSQALKNYTSLGVLQSSANIGVNWFASFEVTKKYDLQLDFLQRKKICHEAYKNFKST